MSRTYAALAGTLKARSGLALGPDKLYLLETRLAPLLEREGLRNLDHLAARLSPGSTLEAAMVEAMTTNETLFFRDGKPFDILRRTTLPRLLAARPPHARLRIWSAAASCGQEAYSIAMVCAEAAPARQIEIVGTDIARAALAQASQGLYSQFEIQRGLPIGRLLRHFTKEQPNPGQPAAWRIEPALRQMVRFTCWNLLADLRPLGRFDVVFCRNVLLYFDQETRRRVLTAIARQMQPDGALVLGSAESADGLTETLRPGEDDPTFYQPTQAT